MELDPKTTPCYAFLVGVVNPRPIAWVTTVSPAGVVNLAPFSFFNVFGDSPPLVIFAPVRKPDGTAKDTLKNLETCPEFVLNTATSDLAEACNRSSAPLPPDESEVAAVGLSTVPSVSVKPPRVAESPAHLECVIKQIIPFGTHPGATTLVLGEVVRIHVNDNCLTDGKPDPTKLRTLGRMGGLAWCHTTDLFELTRPT